MHKDNFGVSWFLSNMHKAWSFRKLEMLSELKTEGISFIEGFYIWFEIESEPAFVISHLNFLYSYILFIYFLDANIFPSQWVHDYVLSLAKPFIL